MSYIKREDALDAVLFALVGTGHQSEAIDAIRDVPTADVVEVVRCKDCKHCKKDSHWKELYCLKMSDDEHTHWLDKDFYCGYGERRTDDEG